MADTLKNRERFSTTLSKETVIKLKEYSNESMIPISKIMDMAIEEYLKNHKIKD